MTDCPRCEQLRAQVQALQTEIGLRMRDGAMGSLMQRFDLAPMPALLVIALYQAKGRACGHEFLVNFIGCPNVENLKVHVCRVRRRMGAGAIVTHEHMGYALSATGCAQVLAAISPAGIQDVRG